MAFAIHNLSAIAYANGFTLWHYTAKVDSLATIRENNYFTHASDMVSTGDMMLCTDGSGAGTLLVFMVNGFQVTTTSMT